VVANRLMAATMTGTIRASPRASGNRPAGITNQGAVTKLITARAPRQMPNPINNESRIPMASTSEPTMTVNRVIRADQTATMKPAGTSPYPRSLDNHRTNVEFTRP